MNDLSDERHAPEGELDPCAPLGEIPFPLGARGRVGFLLVRVGTLLEDIADERLADSGVDSRGYSILTILSVDSPGSQFELARMLGKAPGVVVGEIDALEQKGFVERNRDPQDRRRSRVTLTKAGRAALKRADELAEATVGELLGGLDGDEIAELSRLLVKGLALESAAQG